MTVVANNRIRFMDNNFASLARLTDYGSAKSGYPVANIFDVNRSKKWVSDHCFVIDSTNNKIYINDGSDKIVTLTSGKYSGTSLAVHIATQLNAASSSWSVAYSLTTYIFTISRGASATLRLSQTTSSTWNTLGYLLITDQVGTSFPAQAPRIHSEEYFIFDMGFARPIDFVALISPIDGEFGISTGATITVQGSNLNNFITPAITFTVPVYETGAFKFIDDQFSTYRYWKVKIYDPGNTTGEISFSHIYLGDYETITQSNVAVGFEMVENDLTVASSAESGKLYFDEGIKYTGFNTLGLGGINLADKDKLIKMWQKLGRSTPLYVSLDPTVAVSTQLKDLTKFVYFNDQPIFTQVINNVWSMAFAVREVI